MRFLSSYRGLNELISVRTSSDGEGRRVGGAASENWCRRLAKGLTLHPFRLVKNKWRLEQRGWSRGHWWRNTTTTILSPTEQPLYWSRYHTCNVFASFIVLKWCLVWGWCELTYPHLTCGW